MDPVSKAVRRTCDAVCRQCELAAVCAMAPTFLRLGAGRGERRPHPSAEELSSVALVLRGSDPSCSRGLLKAMADPDPARAHAAGCLLASVWWDTPEKIVPFIEAIAEKAGGKSPRPLASYEGQIVRVAALLQPPGLGALLSRPHPVGRAEDPEEVDAYGAIRAIASLLSRELTPAEWAGALEAADPLATRCSFVLREPDEGETLDLFFAARLGGKTAVFYLRRDAAGDERLTSIDAVRVSSILARLFKVFDSDERKCYRLFAKICRYLNKHAEEFSAARLLEGFRSLTKDDLFVLAMYAPNLARLMERQLEWNGLYRLVKYLHNFKGVWPQEPGRASEAHAKVFSHRRKLLDLVQGIGRDTFKDFCRTLFRIAAAFHDAPHLSSVMFRLGEVAYFMTALVGLNPKGLEISLEGENPLAYIAYGMQPPSKTPEKRYQRLRRVAERFAGSSPEVNSVRQGLYYMAKTHGFQSEEEFADAMMARSGAARGDGGAAGEGSEADESSAGGE